MASSAVPFLTPVAIISRSLMCKSLIYWNDSVNWTLVQERDAAFMRGAFALHRGCVSCGGNGQDCGFRFPAHFDCRMEQLGENFEAGDQTRTGPREVAVGIERISAAVSNRRNLLPAGWKSDGAILFTGLRCTVSARPGDQEIWLRGDHIIERHPERRAAGLAKDVAASGELNHFRNPVTADVDWLEPFEEGDGRGITTRVVLHRGINFPLERAEFFADGFNQLLGGMGAKGLFADQENVAPDVAEIKRIE